MSHSNEHCTILAYALSNGIDCTCARRREVAVYLSQSAKFWFELLDVDMYLLWVRHLKTVLMSMQYLKIVSAVEVAKVDSTDYARL